jgi:hypothetical protein
MKVICFDIETYPDFFSVAAKDIHSKEEYWFCKTGLNTIINENNTFDNFIESIIQKKNCFFIGYNSIKFDNPVISYAREENRTISEVSNFANICASKKRVKGSPEHNLFSKYTYKKTFGKFYRKIQSIDLILYFNTIDRVSLKKLGITLNLPYLIELPHKPGTHLLKLGKSKEDIEQDMKKYNFNDVIITEALYSKMYPEIKLRADVGAYYGIELSNTSRSVMGMKIFKKMYLDMYPEMTEYLNDSRTHYKSIDFADIVSSKVNFKTKKLQNFLQEVKSQKFTAVDEYLNCKKEVKFERIINIGNMAHTFKVGGIHSNNKPDWMQESFDYVMIDADVTSFYPTIMLQERAYPNHLGEGFLQLFEIMVNQRIVAKKTGNKIQAEALKIVINSIYGKMGSPKEFFYDPKSLYKVTINGQLYLLMLAERLDSAGIDVFYSNTDGLTSKVPKDKISEYYRICKEWESELKMELEYVKIKKFLIRDVNNYILEDEYGNFKEKGDFKQTISLGKQIDSPIVAKALKKYYFDGIPIASTIKSLQNISPLDYIISQKIGDTFTAELQSIRVIGEPINIQLLPNINRYYAAKGHKSGYLFKIAKIGESKGHLLKDSPVIICNNLSDFDIDTINFRYYEEKTKSIISLISKSVNQLKLF